MNRILSYQTELAVAILIIVSFTYNSDMGKIELIDDCRLGFGFLENDEYKFRNLVNGEDSNYRHLTEEEITVLRANLNTSDDWNNILVSDVFDPSLIKNSSFYGKIRIGRLKNSVLQFHDFKIKTGIYSSTVLSSDIGDDCSINEVSYMSNYIIHERCILHCIKEIQTTNHSKFGNGIVKEGEDPEVRITLSVINENQGRSIAPFEDMLCADAALWACYRDEEGLSESLTELTDNTYSTLRGWYGEIGADSVIKNCGIIKDVKTGQNCYIKGCNKLKNLTVKSTYEEPTQLGEGIELVNGIVGEGCSVFYGCKAIRFVMGENSNLKYGARLINSYLGDNSTVSCCEVLSNLVFPFHEQHHNNSFLISSLVMGQSNMAAGSNIGSNHNSRGADCEMRAGRGFWPALSSTIKFNSRFASFVLIAKGNYPYELNVNLPFALLVADNEDRRAIMPAYWWMYNMYALERNSNKFAARDKRVYAKQHIETDYLAPDTACEIVEALDYLESCSDFAVGMENSGNPVRILKKTEGMRAYKTMLIYYSVKEICKYCSENNEDVSSVLSKSSQGCMKWENLGGQLVPSDKLEKLLSDIKNKRFKTWNEIHEVYDTWYKEYPLDKVLNAACILEIINGRTVSQEDWELYVKQLADIRSYIEKAVYTTRQKDFNNKFRYVTYRSQKELESVIGNVENDELLKKEAEKTKIILSWASNVSFFRV